jgi:CBS domain-containing protein/ribosome-associated translation inhibitor RaiA
MFESKPVTAAATSSISEIMGILENNDVYEVFIEDEKKLGTITVRDILKASDITNMKASSLMTPVIKLSPNDTVGKAARLMSDYRLRALPIGKEMKVGAAVTIQSLCNALLSLKEFAEIRIDKMMKRNLMTVRESDSASKARNLMVKNSIDHLPVLDSGKLCGILLSSHIAFSLVPKERMGRGIYFHERVGLSDLKVSGVMDSDPMVCAPEEKAAEVLKKMLEQGKTYTIIELWGELQGIATYRDFVHFLAEPEKLEVAAYIVGLPSDPFEAELARMKFIREANTLRKSFPDIEEIRSTIKTKKGQSEKHRYEVSVSIRTHGKVHSYSEEGWDLPSIFDSVQAKMKRLLTQRVDKRRRESIRKVW